ncbi:MAG: hypothetical protein J6D23_01760 [Clostridia bacterium]|nr:hypothetical protein [Clostridia bacterium]
MKKIPICLNIDDGCPTVHIYHYHLPDPSVRSYGDKSPLLPTVPNSIAYKFCDIANKYGLKGKLSIVPLPARQNPYETEEGKEWCKVIKENLSGKFSFCCEMLTHEKTLDLKTNTFLDIMEGDWSQSQDKEALRKYIELSLKALDSRGFEVSGVTSPWNFGEENLDNYINAISEAYYNVFGKKKAWFFLHYKLGYGKPELVLNKDGCQLVSIPTSVDDFIWECTEFDKTDDEFINWRADLYITKDGKGGQIIDVINNGGIPVLLTHWSSLFSNGRQTGLKVLELVAKRIKETLSETVEFVSFDTLMEMTINGEI